MPTTKLLSQWFLKFQVDNYVVTRYLYLYIFSKCEKKPFAATYILREGQGRGADACWRIVM